MSESPQSALTRLAATTGDSLSALSRMMGRNPAYLHQYVTRGSPRVLPERERGLLARYFGVAETELGATPREEDGEEVAVPYLDVAASAGGGRHVEGERVRRHVPLGRAALRAAGIAPATASIIDVSGDSMAPTLIDGDWLVVDTASRAIVGGAVHVAMIEDMVAVKRLRRDGALVRVDSDNPAFAPRLLPAGQVRVIGRARLLWRTL